MKEKTGLLIAIVASLIIFIISNFIFPQIMLGDNYVELYEANITNSTLNETYVYHVSGKHYMYRYFTNASLGEDVNLTYLSCPEGAVGYWTDSKRSINVLNSTKYIPKNVGKNEVGCFSPIYPFRGSYVVNMGFSFRPEERFVLASEHIPYKKVIINTDKPHIPISGGVYSGELVISGATKTELFYHRVVVFLNLLFMFAGLIFPVFVYLIYKKYGEEKFFVVPERLNYAPNPNRKAWEVAGIFSKPGVVNTDFIVSTILDLRLRGVVEIDDKVIRVLRKDEVDEVEKKILEFLGESDGLIDLNRLKFEASSDSYRLKIRGAELKKLIDKKLYEYLDTKGKNIISLVFVFSFFSTFLIFFLLKFTAFSKIPGMMMLFVRSLFLVVETIVPVLLPANIFGRWKGDLAKEKMEWDSFGKFLSDEAMIRKYGTEDLSIWEKWLVYGASLGVADKVLRAMSELGIATRFVREYEEIKSPVRVAVMVGFSYSNSSSGTSSFGSGFGGGGAGVR